MDVAQRLIDRGYRSYMTGFSALDKYYGLESTGILSLAAETDLVGISSLFEDVRYPSIGEADILVEGHDTHTQYLIQALEEGRAPYGRLRHTSFWFDFSKRTYQDPLGIYPDLRKPGMLDIPSTSEMGSTSPWAVAADAAVLVARYGFTIDDAQVERLSQYGKKHPALLAPMEQQLLIKRLSTSKDPAKGLIMLDNCGFIRTHWPLIASMKGVEQDKDFHPEGDVWEHTLETFSHLKQPDLGVFLALLLHDCGKAFSSPSGKNRFDRHAQIGASRAKRFLQGLEFHESLVDQVVFLVKEHMLPSLISKLPVYRTEQVMEHPAFSDLLEVYRCDVSSAFYGLDGYYKACEIYRRYLRHKRNPFRGNDGKQRRSYG